MGSRLRRIALLTAVLTLAAAAAASASRPSLRGYWPMSEGSGQVIADASRNGNDGRIGRTNVFDPADASWIRGPWRLGSALHFDGNDFVVMPDTASLRPQRVTVAAWVRSAVQPGSYKYIVSKGGDRCQAGSFGLYTSANGGMAFYVYDGRRWHRSPEAGTALWDGGWHFVAGRFDGKAVRLYVDGRQVGSGSRFRGSIAYDLPARDVYIGAYRGACDLTFPGDVDEVRIWSGAVSPGKLDRVRRHRR